jgi:hypothetical protein
MALADIFNFSSLIILGILLLVVCLLVLYFENKMREQNHKIASMLSLVSSLAEELNGIKFGMNHIVMRGGANLDEQNLNFNASYNNELNNTKLVIVSDDEDDDEDDEVSIDGEELESASSDEESVLEESESESDNECESEIESVSDGEEELVLEDIKVFKLSHDLHIDSISTDEDNLELGEMELDEMDILEEFEELEGDEIKSVGSSKSTVTTTELLKNKRTPTPIQEQSQQLEISSSDLKTININLEEHLENVDYKKLSLQKLKSVVVEKGLINDASKLKKNELLKLLGVE